MRRLRDEDGAVAVITGLLIVVLLGVGALALDVGALHWEARQLQNGADAAALAIAYDCAGGSCGTASVTAQAFADANANDDASSVEELCGQGVAGVSPCANPPSSLPSGASYIRVSTRTGSDAGAGLVPPILGQMLVPGWQGETVHRAATAIWSGVALPPQMDALPLTASMCDFMGGPGPFTPAQLDAKAASLPAVDDLPKDSSGNVTGGVLIKLHDASKDTDACTFHPGFSGDGVTKMPGGFGWLDTVSNSSCTVNIVAHEVDGQFWVPATTGMSPVGRTCLVNNFRKAPAIPVFTGFRTAGKQYRLYAPAAFYITGIDIPGEKRPSGFNCGLGGGVWCVRGHFVRKMDSSLPPVPGPNLGITAVSMHE